MLTDFFFFGLGAIGSPLAASSSTGSVAAPVILGKHRRSGRRAGLLAVHGRGQVWLICCGLMYGVV